ncbi:rod-binding protein [Croceicoccus marinus]|uniref:Rod-binding protein n=2 Tax=Croceicoccus marinus TaxID=450378 RepID=A0A7G6VY54_9SPHN|nr:rod-binding protein [Croceicoccus marinus]
MLSAARDSSIRSDLFGSNGSDTFRQMRDDAFADIASERGVLGLADLIEAQMSRNLKG